MPGWGVQKSPGERIGIGAMDEKKQVTVKIDGREVSVPAGSTILEAAEKANIDIPTLCHHPDMETSGVCRVCVVQVNNNFPLQAACVYEVAEGMEIDTSSKVVRDARRMNLELILASHPQDCLSCIRNQNCELQELAQKYHIEENRFPQKTKEGVKDTTNPSVVRDQEKCILCRRCVEACIQFQSVETLSVSQRGHESKVGTFFNKPMEDVVCTFCGQCIVACPVGALYEKNDTQRVWEAIADPDKHVVVQTAPAIRVGLGEEMGDEPGSLTTGQMVASLRRIGFDRVFDTNFTADLTIMEEGSELIQRVKEGGTLPMITSCSPGWIKFCEHHFPDMLDNLSTCKSPQQMFGALAKTFYAEKAGIHPKDIFSVSIMPCTAKKFERARPEMTDSGYTDVDVVLTTREVGQMLRELGVRYNELPDEKFDDPLGISTGAAAIFGATGGVMEAALRTAYELITGEELKEINLHACRGLDGVKEAEIPVGDLNVKIAVAHGLANARKLLEAVQAGEKDYHFIEVMACPGGCIGGGGQPIPATLADRDRRIAAIYREDERLEIRKSHENPAIKAIYEEYLEKPLSHKSHHLLHTKYTKRGL